MVKTYSRVPLCYRKAQSEESNDDLQLSSSSQQQQNSTSFLHSVSSLTPSNPFFRTSSFSSDITLSTLESPSELSSADIFAPQKLLSPFSSASGNLFSDASANFLNPSLLQSTDSNIEASNSSNDSSLVLSEKNKVPSYKNSLQSIKKKTTKRSKFTLQEKKKFIDSVLEGRQKGKTFKDIAEEFNIQMKTLHKIWKNKAKIESRLSDNPDSFSTTLSKKHSPILEKMEVCLWNWLQEQENHGAIVDIIILQMKAKEIHKGICSQVGIKESFEASEGWARRFCKRHEVSFKKRIGEAAMIDQQVAVNFANDFEKMIIQENYHLDQIFNVDELGLFWNKQPTHTYTTSKTNPRGHKESKKRVSALIGSNASGTLKLTPLVIHKSLNPRDMKGINREALPVIFEANSNAWMTGKLFRWWFQSYFGPAIMDFLYKNGHDQKALLVLDNAPCHPTDLEYPGIKVVFLPANYSMVLQPMDQCPIKAFKSYYVRNLLRQPFMPKDQSGKVRAFASKKEYETYWKTMKISTCIEHIEKAWNEVKQSTLANAWTKLLPSLSTTNEEREIETLPENETAAVAVLRKEIFQGENAYDWSHLSEEEVGFLRGEAGAAECNLESAESPEEDNEEEVVSNESKPNDDEVDTISVSIDEVIKSSIEVDKKILFSMLDKLSREEMKNVICYLTEKL